MDSRLAAARRGCAGQALGGKQGSVLHEMIVTCQMHRTRKCRSANLARGRADRSIREQRHAGEPTCTFPVQARRITWVRLRTAKPVAEIEPFTEWADLVSAHKGPALGNYLPKKKGCPSRGS